MKIETNCIAGPELLATAMRNLCAGHDEVVILEIRHVPHPSLNEKEDLATETDGHKKWRFSYEKLAALRRSKGINQQDISTGMRIVRTAISNVENGVYAPSFELFLGLANALGMHPGYFFEEDHGDTKNEQHSISRKELRSLLKDRGLTQAQFAEKLNAACGSNLSGVNISEWITGRKHPTEQVFAAIVSVLDVEPKSLAGLLKKPEAS